jgi:hypothetical protein
MTTNPTALVGGADGARPDICTSPLCQLAKLASFATGYHLKPAQKDPHGNVVLVQKQDLADGMLANKLQRARLTKPSPARTLRAGDVLVHAQGVGYALALWDAPVPNALCVAPLIRIRPHDPASLLPGFLLWFLRSSVGQKKLARYAGEGERATCLRESLHAMTLYLPDLAVQRQIADADTHWRTNDAQAARLRQALAHNHEQTLLALAQRNGGKI